VPIVDEVARKHPDDVVVRGGETFLALDVAMKVLDEAERRHVRLVGMEGFVVDDESDAVFPALGRITDFVGASPASSVTAARRLLTGSWSTAPSPGPDQIHADARGRHMVVVVLHEP
jgi:hypothetical protein